MEHDYWRKRWGEGLFGGFHEGRPNQHLAKHLSALGGAKRVFVPLCGKAEDLAFLASQGHQVVGVELVEPAVKAFFDERGVKPVVDTHGPYRRYTLDNLTLLAGDFFATTRELLGPVDALYDRAATIALPERMRAGYVKHLRALLPAGARGLVVTTEYSQDQMEGPPFSVPEAELRAHYAGLKVDLVDQVRSEAPRLRDVNAEEKCFVVGF